MPRKTAAVADEPKTATRRKVVAAAEPKTATRRKAVADDAVPKTRTRRSRTKNTDPNKPKKPLNSYLTWFNEFKTTKEWSTKYKTGDMSVTEQARLGGKIWREELSDAKKKPYQDAYHKGMDKYNKEMEKYNASM